LYDSFEVSINEAPAAVTNAERGERCSPAQLNPAGGIVAPAAGGLVFCAGGPAPVSRPPAEHIYPQGSSRTVILDLSSWQGQDITLYLALWAREYVFPDYIDQGYFNSWVFLDNFVMTANP
jgi:hypothetical protein